MTAFGGSGTRARGQRGSAADAVLSVGGRGHGQDVLAASPPSLLLHVDKLTTKLGPLKRKGGRKAASVLPTSSPSLPSSVASAATFHLEPTNDVARVTPSHHRETVRERASLVARPPAVRRNERGNLIFERSSAWHPCSRDRRPKRHKSFSIIFECDPALPMLPCLLCFKSDRNVTNHLRARARNICPVPRPRTPLEA